MAEAADGHARRPRRRSRSTTRSRRCSPTPTPAPITTADGCRAELVDHLTTGVDWVGAIEAMRAAGVTTFIEVGPGPAC